MTKIQETVKAGKAILKILDKGPCCRTDILKLTVREIGSPDRFNRVFDFLVKNGYIVKTGPRQTRTPYMITDLGKRQLEIWEVRNQV